MSNLMVIHFAHDSFLPVSRIRHFWWPVGSGRGYGENDHWNSIGARDIVSPYWHENHPQQTSIVDRDRSRGHQEHLQPIRRQGDDSSLYSQQNTGKLFSHSVSRLNSYIAIVSLVFDRYITRSGSLHQVTLMIKERHLAERNVNKAFVLVVVEHIHLTDLSLDSTRDQWKFSWVNLLCNHSQRLLSFVLFLPF